LLLLLLLLLLQLIQGCQTPEEQSLAYVTLCKRMLSQCEVQVARISSFAFPLAYVCVAVGAAAPQFMELLLAKLQQVRARV
jgi:nucleoporin GLE1